MGKPFLLFFFIPTVCSPVAHAGLEVSLANAGIPGTATSHHSQLKEQPFYGLCFPHSTNPLYGKLWKPKPRRDTAQKRRLAEGSRSSSRRQPSFGNGQTPLIEKVIYTPLAKSEPDLGVVGV